MKHTLQSYDGEGLLTLFLTRERTNKSLDFLIIKYIGMVEYLFIIPSLYKDWKLKSATLQLDHRFASRGFTATSADGTLWQSVQLIYLITGSCLPFSCWGSYFVPRPCKIFLSEQSLLLATESRFDYYRLCQLHFSKM